MNAALDLNKGNSSQALLEAAPRRRSAMACGCQRLLVAEHGFEDRKKGLDSTRYGATCVKDFHASDPQKGGMIGGDSKLKKEIPVYG